MAGPVFMRVSEWSCGSYPIYLDPSLEELVEIANGPCLDTLRIQDSTNHFAIASGYGNTHDNILTAARRHWPKWCPDDLILVRTGNDWYWNHLGHWNIKDEGVSLEEGYSLVSKNLALAIKDITTMHSAKGVCL